jgi:murein DD-endopeptidase MepM/ murein hydrolase activator NlpD
VAIVAQGALLAGMLCGPAAQCPLACAAVEKNLPISRLQEMDLRSQLQASSSSVEALQQRLAAHAREHDQRLRRLEDCQATADRRLAALAEQFDSVVSDQSEALLELRELTKSTMAEVLSRVADQFDAVQSALDATEERTADEAGRADRNVDALRIELEARLGQLRSDLEARLGDEAEAAQASRRAAAATADAHALRLDAAERRMEESEARAAAEADAHHRGAETLRGDLEARVASLGGKFEEYTFYLRRLRKEVAALRRAGDSCTREVEAKLGAAGGKMWSLHRGAAALLTELHQAAAAAGDARAVLAAAGDAAEKEASAGRGPPHVR